MLKIKFLKMLDGLLGVTAVSLLPRPCRQDVNPLRSILLIRPGGIGDALLLAPTICSLRRQLPGISIDILAEKRNIEAFYLIGGLRNIYRYDDFMSLLKVLTRQYDVVIDTEQWYRLSAVVARLVRTSMKIGFSNNRRRRMFTNPVAYDLKSHEAEMFSTLLAPLGLSVDISMESPSVKVRQRAFQNAQEMMGSYDRKEDIVVIFPGASVPEKRWSHAKFHALVGWCENKGIRVVIVGGKQDCEAGRHIAKGTSALDLSGKTSLGQTAAVLELATLVVSNDSGILHMASALGRPTVALFGASSLIKWAPRGSRSIVIDKNLDCSPCSSFGTVPKCPFGVRCMDEISVADVTAAVNRLLTINQK